MSIKLILNSSLFDAVREGERMGFLKEVPLALRVQAIAMVGIVLAIALFFSN